MTKDEQIKFLGDTLRTFAGHDFLPFHGDDAVAMHEEAKDALWKWEIASQQNNAADEYCQCKLEGCWRAQDKIVCPDCEKIIRR